MKAMKVALVTGASEGIGYCYCCHLAKDKMDLVLVARNEQKLETVAQQLRQTYGVQVWVFAQDLGVAGAAERIFNFTQAASIQVDLLINNAGYADVGSFTEVAVRDHGAMLQCMINSLVELCYYYLPSMLARDSATIINVGSIAGIMRFNLKGRKLRLLYGPIKTFAIFFSKQLFDGYKDRGLYCQCLCPGLTYSEFHRRIGEAKLYGSTPKWFWMSADQVVKKSLAAMDRRKRCVVVTGWLNKLVVCVAKIKSTFFW